MQLLTWDDSCQFEALTVPFKNWQDTQWTAWASAWSRQWEVSVGHFRKQIRVRNTTLHIYVTLYLYNTLKCIQLMIITPSQCQSGFLHPRWLFCWFINRQKFNFLFKRGGGGGEEVVVITSMFPVSRNTGNRFLFFFWSIEKFFHISKSFFFFQLCTSEWVSFERLSCSALTTVRKAATSVSVPTLSFLKILCRYVFMNILDNSEACLFY